MANGDDFRHAKNHLRLRQGLLILPALALATWFWALSAQADMNVDEYTTWMLGRMSWPQFWQNRLENGHMPLWFALSVLVRPLTGESELGLRSPAGLLFGLTVLSLLLLPRAGLARRTSALALALVALNQVALWAGLNARPSILLQLGGTMLLLGGEILRNRGGRWPLITVAAGSILGMGAGAAFAGTALSYAVYAWFASTLRRVRRPLAVAALLGPLIWLPVLGILSVTQKKYDPGSSAVVRTINPERYISPLGEVVLGENARGMRLALAVVFVAGMVAGSRRHPLGAAGAALFGGTWLTLSVAQLITGHSVLGHGRYFSPGLVGGLVAFAVGLESWGRSLRHMLRNTSAFVRVTGSLARAVLPLAMLGMAAYNSYDYSNNGGDGVRQMVAALLRRPSEKMVLPEGAAFRYEFLRQGAPQRYAPALLTPRGLDPKTSATANALLTPLWNGPNSFYLVVYNNKQDPLDGVLKNPPKGWTATERMQFRDTRTALMMRAPDPAFSPPTN